MESRKLNLRTKFVILALEPDANMAELCRRFEISRPTGYKWLNRYREHGLEGLVDRSRRPNSSQISVDGEAVLQVLELRGEHKRWGPKKLRAVLIKRGNLETVPSERTIARILQRADVIPKRRQRRKVTHVAVDAPDVAADAPNDVWTIDFKGWWHTGDGNRVEPLTVRDACSRFVLAARAMESTRTEEVRAAFEDLFERYGLPKVLQMDNGSPFACTAAIGGFTRLSAWWVSLGITLVRSRPGHPQDNGGHERMHLDMRYEVEDVPADDMQAQQDALTTWRVVFNHERPHEALDMNVPADLYSPSKRRYRGPHEPKYTAAYIQRKVMANGHIKLNGNVHFVSTALSGYRVGLRPADDLNGWLCRFYDVDLGVLRSTMAT